MVEQALIAEVVQVVELASVVVVGVAAGESIADFERSGLPVAPVAQTDQESRNVFDRHTRR